jgi:putative ABC transport system permease protein
MFKNYLKIAWRTLLKNKVFTFINIFGLTTGLTVCLMIFLFVINEFSVDNFHKKGQHIYRVMREFDPGKPPTPYLAGPYAPALLNDFPGEITSAVRVMVDESVLIEYNNRPFMERRGFWADSNFFTLFSFPLLKGNPATALKDPNAIVLTETTAKKYFGKEDPMGKIVTLDRNNKMVVTGVAKDPPVNSHLNFDLVLPLNHISSFPFMKAWMNNNTFTYVLLDEHAQKTNIERRLPAFMQKYMAAEMTKSGYHFSLSLTPLKDVYFENASGFDNVKHGDKKVVYVFLSIAVLILLVACINFTNLSTVRAVERRKEVGLRKVMGALQTALTQQFLGESLLLAIISCMLSLGLLQLLMPVYNGILGYELAVPYTAWWLYAFLGGAAIVVALLAGIYPALILSRFSPIEALKGSVSFIQLGKGGSVFRQALVVIQFSISVFLITGTIIIAKQMTYLKNKELGYDQAQTLVIPIFNSDIQGNKYIFKQALQSNSNISAVCLMTGQPGGAFDEHVFDVEGQDGKNWKARVEFADFEFVKTLGLKIIAGRDLSAEFPTDTLSAVLINRTAAASLGFTPKEAIGKWIRNRNRDSTRRRVVGVVEDFNYTSLKENIDPLVIAPNPERYIALVKLRPGNLQEKVDQVKNAYARFAPAYPFEYGFLDQNFDFFYKKDLRQQKILNIFSGLAILIACLGLFGLTSFTTARRSKEIGIRKVLGSSVKNIIILLSKDLLKPVLLATIIAVPIAYAVMHNWLQSFAYRTGMQWWIFVLAAGITIVIALCTVALKAAKAAIADPVKSLRSE